MRLGLRAQILFYLLLTLVVACGLFSVLALHLMQRALYHEWQKRWVTRAQEIAEDTRSLDRLAGRPSGRSIIRGEALIELSRTHPSLSEALQKVPRDHEKSPLVVWVRAGGNRLLIGRSRGPQREPFALVSDFPRFRNETRSVRLLVIGYLGFATLLALLVGVFLLQRSVVKPVDQMLSTISRLSVAVMERPISLDLTNNLQVLNRSIETMAETLRDKQERIQKHLEHLKRVNEELARTQDSLVLSEKLASVGQLAAGVAHEIGNPLSSILGYLELLVDPQTTDTERRDFLARVNSETQRIHQIIQNLLTYARPTSDEDGADPRCDVRSVVRSCVELVKPQKRFKELTLTIDLADELPMARITAGKLQQVLVNLLFNAADALGEAEISAPTVRIHGETLDSRLSLYVSDNGPGIAPEHLRRIFDPFFTTKEPGSGTGLGLSISQQILKHVGGDLRVEASVGGGATFVIDLPLIAAGGGVAL